MEESVSRLACFAPTQMELEVVLRQFHEDRRWEDDPLWMATGKLYGRDAVLVRTGIGPENAARAAERVLDSFALEEILLAGFAGGTVPTLAPTGLFVCKKTMDGGDSSDSARARSVPSAKGLIDRALATGFVSAVSSAVTVARVVTSAKDKLALGTRYGVELVEMEGFPLLHRAYERGVPGLMVRVVLDGSDENLPDSTTWLCESGRVRVPALLAYLAFHPTYVVQAVRLFDRAKNCQRCLHRFTEAYLSGVPPSSSSPK